MKTKKLAPVHPGEILFHDFMEPLGLSQYALARAIGVKPMRVGFQDLVAKGRDVEADRRLAIRKAPRHGATFLAAPRCIPAFRSETASSPRTSPGARA